MAVLLAVLFSISLVATAEPDQEIKRGRDFSGFYVGAGISANHLSADVNHTSESESKLGYAGMIGWRYSLNNNWVLGIEGSLGDADGKFSNAQAEFKFDYNWHWSASAGKVFGAQDHQLIYVKLGVGGIQVKGEFNNQRLGSHNYKGTRTAIGYERVLTEQLNLKAELSFVSYDSGLDFEQIQNGISLVYKF